MVAKYLIIKSPRGIRFNDRFVAKYLIIKSSSGIRFNDRFVAKYLIIKSPSGIRFNDRLVLGFPVVITLRVIARNTFFHLRRSITRNYAFITFTKESLISRN